MASIADQFQQTTLWNQLRRKLVLIHFCIFRSFSFFFIQTVLIILFSFYFLDPSIFFSYFSFRVSAIFTYASSFALRFSLQTVIIITHKKMTWPFCRTISFCFYFTYQFDIVNEKQMHRNNPFPISSSSTDDKVGVINKFMTNANMRKINYGIDNKIRHFFLDCFSLAKIYS